MADISVHQLHSVKYQKNLQYIIPTDDFLIYVYTDYMYISKLGQFYDQIRITQETQVILPPMDTQNIFLQTETGLYVYNFEKKNISFINFDQYITVFQVNSSSLIASKQDEFVYINVNNDVIQISSQVEISHTSFIVIDDKYIGVLVNQTQFMIIDFKELIISQVIQLEQSVVDVIKSNQQLIFIGDKSIDTYSEEFIRTSQTIHGIKQINFAQLIDEHLHLFTKEDIGYEFAITSKVITLRKCLQKYIKVSQQYIYLDLGQQQFYPHIEIMEQNDDKYSNRIILAHIKTIYYTQIGLFFMTPIIILYNIDQSQIEILNIVSFKSLKISSPKIDNFCLSSSVDFLFLAVAINLPESNESLINIYKISDEFSLIEKIGSFYILGSVKSIAVYQHNDIICSVVSNYNTVYIQNITQDTLKCINPQRDIVFAMILPQNDMVYCQDSQQNGILIYSESENSDYIETHETSLHIFQQFTQMLMLFSPTDMFTIDYPLNKDVEQQCFLYNAQQVFIQYQNQVPLSLLEIQQQNQNFNQKHGNIQEYYVQYKNTFHLKLKKMLAKLEIYMNDCNKTFSIIGQSNTSFTQSTTNFEPSNSTIQDQNRSLIENRQPSVLDLSQKEYKPSHNKKLDLPDFWDLRSKFLQYDTFQLLSHSLCRTIHFSRYYNSEIFSYQLQSIFCDKVDLKLNQKAQFMIQQFCIRILPIFAYITQNMQDIQEINNFISLINTTFNTQSDFDFEQFQISFSIDQTSFSSQKDYFFTVSFISIFTIFSFLHQFQVQAQNITDSAFNIIENAFKAYFQANNNYLSLYNIYDYMCEQAIHINYSCFTILRLYQQIASEWFISHSVLNQYISHVLSETQNLTLKVQQKRQNEIPVYIIILESLAEPVCSVISRSVNNDIFDNTVRQHAKTEHELSKDAISAISSIKQVIKQILFKCEQYNEAMYIPNIPQGHFANLGLLLHSLSYNLFFLTTILGFEDQYEVLNNAGSIDDSEQILEIIQVLIKFSAYFENENLRTYAYEQLTQFFLKTRRECFINVFINLIQKNQNSGCFESINKYFVFLKFNYPALLHQFGNKILEDLLPISRQIFQTFIQTKGSKQLVHDLLKIVSVVSRVCDKVQSINLANHSMIYYVSQHGQIGTFDYQEYSQSSITINKNSNFDLLRQFEIKDKFIMCISLNTDKIAFIRAGTQDVLLLPIIPNVGNPLFQSVIVKKKFIPSDDFIYVSTVETEDRYCVTISNQPSNTIHIFKLRSLQIVKSDDVYGYFKSKVNHLTKNILPKKLLINVVVDEDTIQFVIKQ